MRWLLLVALLGATCEFSWARSHRPASGRRLAHDHWLTCRAGEGSATRNDPHFHKDSPEAEVAQYIPRFAGEYEFEVLDTWKEIVTHHGANCFKCGETCSGHGKDKTCSCDVCSWQEEEIMDRPWSVQKVNWDVEWVQDRKYRERRKAWLKERNPISRTKQDLEKLFEFDPERPLEYFLFPGEHEQIHVASRPIFPFDGIKMQPFVHMDPTRHEYDIVIETKTAKGKLLPAWFDCDDHDLNIKAYVKAKRRILSSTPNSIEFRAGWLAPDADANGVVHEEPNQFTLTDVAAMRYEQQDVFDNYKDTHIEVSLKHVSRMWWVFDTRISHWAPVDSMVLEWAHQDQFHPAVGLHKIYGSDLYQTWGFQTPFHLQPGQRYEVCARMKRDNNIYYDTSELFGLIDIWSEPHCALFHYVPPEDVDFRSMGRKTRDLLARFVGFGFL